MFKVRSLTLARKCSVRVIKDFTMHASNYLLKLSITILTLIFRKPVATRLRCGLWPYTYTNYMTHCDSMLRELNNTISLKTLFSISLTIRQDEASK